MLQARVTSKPETFYDPRPLVSEILYDQWKPTWKEQRFSYAGVKTSIHGTTILHVPGKEVYFDLTIHMDVQANPGTAALPNCGRQTANFFLTSSTCNCPKLYYSRDQLMSFRPSCFSTKRLNPQLIRQLKDFNILKYRGKSSGTRVNKEAIKIPIINKERFIVQHN